MESFELLGGIVLAWCIAPVALAQVDENGHDRRLYDDLLDHFVGKWDVSATVHGQKFTLDREAQWVMSHQYLRIYGEEPRNHSLAESAIRTNPVHRVQPWQQALCRVRIDRARWQHPNEPEGFYYAERMGNELKMVLTNGSEVVGNARFTWEPASGSWHFQDRRVIAGNEQEPTVDQTAVAAK